MIHQSIFALFLTSVTVLVHAMGTVYIAIPAAGVWTRRVESPGSPRPVWTLIRLVSLLLTLHLVESAVWAAAFAVAGVLPNFKSALYYSITSYPTVGYGDVLPATSWRLPGPIEAAVGVLMLGWSTAIIMAAVERIDNSRSPSSEDGATHLR
jgi:voltage-gated potassium channel